MKARGRLIAEKLVAKLVTLSESDGVSFPFTPRRSRIPKVKLEDLGTERADVTVAALTKAGDEQDRSSELLLYGISVGVTANVGTSESEAGDMVEDLVEEIHNFLTKEENQCIQLDSSSDLDDVADLELPFVNDPVFNLNLLQQSGVYQSITVFAYMIERSRE